MSVAFVVLLKTWDMCKLPQKGVQYHYRCNEVFPLQLALRVSLIVHEVEMLICHATV